MIFDKEPKEKPKKPSQERRTSERYLKNLILNYFDPVNPDKKHEITQLKNISKGGICFITSKPFAEGTVLGIELNTPFITDTTYLEGVIHASHEKMKDHIYETRLEFHNLTHEAKVLLEMLIEYFEKMKKLSE